MTDLTINALFNLTGRLPLEAATLLFFVTGGLLFLIEDWRLSVGLLTGQYLTMGLVVGRLLRPEIGYAKVLVGLFIGLMLYLSARQAGWRQRLTFATHGLRTLLTTTPNSGNIFPPGRAFRLMTMLLAGVTAVSLAQSYPLGHLPHTVTLSVYWLMIIGLLVLLFTGHPLKVGQGLLTFITGFEIWFITLEGSLLMAGLWAVINLMITLAAGYLAAVRGVNPEENF